MVSFYLILSLVLICAVSSSTALSKGDVDILNFALNLECLEAQFYSYAVYGVGLSKSLRGNGPAPVGGKEALMSTEVRAIAKDIATDEIRHVRLLRAVLGKHAVPCPLINIGSAFSAAANAAFGTTLSPDFTPYGSDVLFLHGAFIFEDVGATAYKGAIAAIEDKGILSAAAGILGTESYHAGAIRDRLSAIKDEYVFPYATKVKSIVAAISKLRASVGGGKDADLEDLVPADTYSVLWGRNTSEVLNIVYVSGNKRAGGFFPNGMNGNVK